MWLTSVDAKIENLRSLLMTELLTAAGYHLSEKIVLELSSNAFVLSLKVQDLFGATVGHATEL